MKTRSLQTPTVQSRLLSTYYLPVLNCNPRAGYQDLSLGFQRPTEISNELLVFCRHLLGSVESGRIFIDFLKVLFFDILIVKRCDGRLADRRVVS